MVFTAITYGALTAIPNYDDKAKLRSVTLYQVHTSGAGAELTSYFVGGTPGNEAVDQWMHGKAFRIKKISLVGTTLTAVTRFYGVLRQSTSPYFLEYTERVIFTDDDMLPLPITDCVRFTNWLDYTAAIPFLQFLFFPGLTVADNFQVIVVLEVVE